MFVRSCRILARKLRDMIGVAAWSRICMIHTSNIHLDQWLLLETGLVGTVLYFLPGIAEFLRRMMAVRMDHLNGLDPASRQARNPALEYIRTFGS